jgi:DNA topoisomerase-1
MKKLFIVESPAKIKTISKFLGKEFKIMSTVGHIMDLPARKLGVTMGKHIAIEYVPMKDKEKVIAEICKEASKADEIYLATDPDREGEIIAWHIEQEIKKVAKAKAKFYRITYNEITKPAIEEALKHPEEVDLQKVAAQQARRVLDRWVGYEVSPILWKKIAKGLSAGRVQSVTLRLVCDREEQIRNFKPEEYWTVDGVFKHGKSEITAALTTIGKKKAEITDKKTADKVVADLKKAEYVIESITDKTRTKNPLPPFMTSTLQQAGFNRLGFTVKKTMQVAQRLYEGVPMEDKSTPVALITYMRTDSLRISDTALKQARDYVAKNFPKDYLPSKSNVYSKAKKGGTQDAHEAIRPIDVSITPEIASKYLEKDQAKLYEMIWRRFVACQMSPAEYAQRQVVIQGGIYIFKVTGSTLMFDGFLKVYSPEEDEKEAKVILPATIKEKDPLDLKEILPKQHFTQPPPKYTEASLVKEMEKEGIGRPSTYSSILSTIQARAYTTLDAKKRFTPTELGMLVTKLLTEHLPKIMDLKFTALMETELDKIAQGEMERDALLRGFYTEFQRQLKEFVGSDTKRVVEETEVLCPNCGKANLIVRFGKTGEFLGCPRYPECKFTCNFERTEDNKLVCVTVEAPKILQEPCPICGKPLRQVMGRFGPFIACSGYPECKYIYQPKASFKCPLCKIGDVAQRSWRGGKFWGCTRYPDCKFAVFGDIEETPCPQCKLPFLIKKTSKKDGTVTLACWNKECGYKKVIKGSGGQ